MTFLVCIQCGRFYEIWSNDLYAFRERWKPHGLRVQCLCDESDKWITFISPVKPSAADLPGLREQFHRLRAGVVAPANLPTSNPPARSAGTLSETTTQ